MANKTYRHSITGAERQSSRALGYPWAEVKAGNGRKKKAAPATDPDTGTREVEDTSGDEAVEK